LQNDQIAYRHYTLQKIAIIQHYTYSIDYIL